MQCDTLSHLILSRGSTFSLAAIGEIGMMQECIIASEIYSSNQNDVSSPSLGVCELATFSEHLLQTPDMLVKAFQHEKYSQVRAFGSVRCGSRC